MIALTCITRADIPTGLQAAQLMHAAREAGDGTPLNPHEYAIALTCTNEAELQAFSEILFYSGIKHKRIVENDAPWTGQLMAIGIPPMKRSVIRKFTSRLKSLK